MIIGKNIGDYRILAKTQIGESGPVYKAVHISQRQTYALKLLRGPLERENPVHQQFLERLEVVEALNHPHIVRVFPMETHNDILLIPMEFLYGQNLSEKIAESASTIDFTLNVALQAAGALQYAHEAGIVHGRLTSNNLSLSVEGDLKILDFAFAQVSSEMNFPDADETPTATYFGKASKPPLSKFAYLSPEQTEGNSADERSDLFSLGVILYELLLGEFLFEGENLDELYRQIKERDLPKLSQVRPEIPSSWTKMIDALLSKNSSERYPSAKALLEDLRKINYGIPLELLSFQKPDPNLSRRSFFRRFLGEGKA